MFPVSTDVSAWQIVFFNTKTGTLTPSEKVEELKALAESGILNQSIIRLKIGSFYVIDKAKVQKLSFTSFIDRLNCSSPNKFAAGHFRYR